jgi:transposase
MDGHGEKFSRFFNNGRLIAALLECRTDREVCQRLGIGKNTLTRWKRQPILKAALETARRRKLDAQAEGYREGFLRRGEADRDADRRGLRISA